MATKINLLPWRAELREQKKREFLAILGGFAGVGVLIFAVWYFTLESLISYQSLRNQKLSSEIELLDKKLEEINQLKKQRAEMVERMKVIQGLQGTRPLIVHVFDELVHKQPDGIFFTKIERKDNRIFIDGTAESNNRVSTLMRSLNESKWFKNPLLTKVLANPALGEQGTDFNLAIDIAPQSKEEGKK
ncbi:MAG TPA: PilN domain-containing protein [Pseudomonadales bacterium]|nr:PilN domain-containing protein [Pseudomonadales bacterium]